ncbi:MAG: ATP-binding cassette domain-containing protein [Nitrospiria bacterium]
MDKNAAIETHRLSKSFGSTKAVEDLNLAVYAGEVFGLLGPNGAGKTTTMRMLLTLLRPTTGDARIFGYEIVRQAREVRRLIGYVPQEKSVDRYMTGREHLVLMASLYHLSASETRNRVREVLKLVELEDRANELVSNYSGGMKKKLDIACGLIPHPRLMFMDEPSLGLDVQSRLRIWEHIRGLKAKGITLLMSTNYLEEADQLCDRIAIIDGGRVKAIGSPLELKKGLGGDRILIELGQVAPSDIKELAEAIQRFEFVREIHERNNTLEVWINPQEAAFTTLFQKVGNGNYPVQAIHYMRPSLEEVFIRHTGHKIRGD